MNNLSNYVYEIGDNLDLRSHNCIVRGFCDYWYQQKKLTTEPTKEDIEEFILKIEYPSNIRNFGRKTWERYVKPLQEEIIKKRNEVKQSKEFMTPQNPMEALINLINVNLKFRELENIDRDITPKDLEDYRDAILIESKCTAFNIIDEIEENFDGYSKAEEITKFIKREKQK